jgi:hypothetical protein
MEWFVKTPDGRPVMVHVGTPGGRRLYGRTVAVHISGVESWFFDAEGHGMVRENHIGEVHAWLAGRL